MLRREELLVCGRGAVGAGRWEPAPLRRGPEGAYHRAQQPKRVFGGGRGRPGGRPGRRGGNPSLTRAHCRQQQQKRRGAEAWARRCRPARPRVRLSLRPVNMTGMRAPRNTNQFLMREKYQLLHLRSDSVGTESGGSDCERDPLDMDSYLGVLENARGALMDGPCAGESPPPASPPCPFPQRAPGPRFCGGCAEPGAPQEESLPYFPSEDDVTESEVFMERDFQEFCRTLA